MSEKSDITLVLPAEYFDALSATVTAGLKHASIKPEVRKELQAWWNAEKEMIENELSGN